MNTNKDYKDFIFELTIRHINIKNFLEENNHIPSNLYMDIDSIVDDIYYNFIIVGQFGNDWKYFPDHANEEPCEEAFIRMKEDFNLKTTIQDRLSERSQTNVTNRLYLLQKIWDAYVEKLDKVFKVTNKPTIFKEYCELISNFMDEVYDN